MISKEGTTRETWIDATRGIACILVLLGHLLQGLEKSQIIQDAGMYSWFEYTIYFFHVPVFFICSGYLYQKKRRVSTWKARGINILEKAVNLGIPYMVFSVITYMMKLLFNNSVNETQDGGIFRVLFTDPLSPYWYLYILFFLFVCYPTLNEKRQVVITGIIVVILFMFQRNEYVLQIFPVQGILRWGIWFYAGMVIAWSKRKIRFRRITFLLSLSLVPVSFIGFGRELSVIRWILYSMVMGVLGCLLVFQTGCFLTDRISDRLIALCGKYTMSVFLMHTICAAGFRSILLKMGIRNSVIHIAGGIVISIAGSCVIAKLLGKSKYLRWMLYPDFRWKR